MEIDVNLTRQSDGIIKFDLLVRNLTSKFEAFTFTDLDGLEDFENNLATIANKLYETRKNIEREIAEEKEKTNNNIC